MDAKVLGLLSLFAAPVLFGCSVKHIDGGSCSDAIDLPTELPPDAGCMDCLTAHCSSMRSCFGPDWVQGHYGGTCAAYTSCVCDCDTNDTDCAISCAPSASRSCQNCQTQLQDCVVNTCQSACTFRFPPLDGSMELGITDGDGP